MTVLPLLAVGFVMKVVAVLFIVCSVVLILVILVQKGKGGGLSAALGGGMASGILGSKTGDFLTWLTIVLVGIFLTLAGVMAKFYKPTITEFDTGQTGQSSTSAQTAQPAEQQPLPTADVTPSSTDVNKTADTNLPNG